VPPHPVEFQIQRHIWHIVLGQLPQEPVQRGVAAGETVLARQRGMNGGVLDGCRVSAGDLLALRFQRRFATFGGCESLRSCIDASVGALGSMLSEASQPYVLAISCTWAIFLRPIAPERAIPRSESP